MSRVLEAVRKLRTITEQQVDAARRLRSAELANLNQQRVDALFHLRVVLAEEGLPAGERVAKGSPLQSEVRQLDLAEKRLASLAQTVLDRLAHVDPETAPVYGRSGHLP